MSNANSASYVLHYRRKDDKVTETLILLSGVHRENRIFFCAVEWATLVTAEVEIAKMRLMTFVDGGCSSVYCNRPHSLVGVEFDCPACSRLRCVSGSDDFCVGVSHDPLGRCDGDGGVFGACDLSQMARLHHFQQLSVAFVV